MFRNQTFFEKQTLAFIANSLYSCRMVYIPVEQNQTIYLSNSLYTCRIVYIPVEQSIYCTCRIVQLPVEQSIYLSNDMAERVRTLATMQRTRQKTSSLQKMGGRMQWEVGARTWWVREVQGHQAEISRSATDRFTRQQLIVVLPTWNIV